MFPALPLHNLPRVRTVTREAVFSYRRPQKGNSASG
jgi:hypothetical protein